MSEGRAENAVLHSSLSLSMAIRTPRFWTVSLASAVATGSFGLMLAHGVANARDAGHPASDAALMLALVSLSGFAGKAIVGTSADRFSPAAIWGGLMLAMSCGLALLALSPQGRGSYVGAMALGVGFGGVVVSQPATIARLFGAQFFAKIASTVYFLQAIAGIALPWAAGRSFDRFHTYRVSFISAAVGCVISGILLIAFRRGEGAGS